MAFEDLGNVRDALDLQSQKDKSPNLHSALRELQGLKINVVAGAEVNTNIAIAGIGTEDTLVSVLEIQPPTASSGNTVASDRTAVTAITSAGNIQCTEITTGNQLLVIWYNKQ